MKALPYGEDGVYVDLEAGDAEDRAARTHALAASLRAAHPEADVVAGAGAVAVFGLGPSERDALLAELSGARSAEGTRDAEDAAEAVGVGVAHHVHTSAAAARTHAIDVVYDGPDLDDVAARAGLSRAGVVDLHTGREHVVELVGFLPGFAYMGPVDPRLVLPRRPAPRPRVAARSVAIAGAFTGIYPLDSPGGWNLLGRSLGPAPFDPSRDEPFLFAPGDRVRFRAVTAGDERLARAGSDTSVGTRASALPGEGARAALIVVRAAGIATVQDAGRRGLLGRGMPPSGPLDPVLFTAANRAVGNSPGAAAIELLAGALHLRARGEIALSIDGAPPRRLADAEEVRIGEGPGAVRYIAVAGGLDVPVVLGARATLLSAGVGGISGRVLRTGDTAPRGMDTASRGMDTASRGMDTASRGMDTASRGAESPPPELERGTRGEPIEIDPGPHLDRFPASALDVLLAADWRASRLRDRTGMRLEGASIPRSGPDLAAPVPMRRGAIQITTDGTPIVLGPDHPTTGGYPVLAVVRAASLAPLAQRRPGEPVRFRLARG